MAFILYSRNSEVCRACLDQRRETTHVISIDLQESDAEEFTIRYKLSTCMPELDLNATPNAAICTNCLSAINFMLDFKKVWLQVEQNIQNYIRKNGLSHADLVNLIQEGEHVEQTAEVIVHVEQDAEVIVKEDPFNDTFYDHTSNSNEKQEEERCLEKINSSHFNMIEDNQINQDPEEITIKNEPCDDPLYFHASNFNEVKIEENNSDVENSDLLDHTDTQTGKKQYECTECPYKCTRVYRFKQHMRVHTGETPYKCELCDYQAAQRSTLIYHTRTHTGEKQYVCTECPFKCARGYSLKQHMRVHTGETPYECKLCDYKSATNTALIRHISKHTGEKQYECKECSYKSDRAYSLKRHMRVHTGETPYECKVCDYKATQSSHLTDHMRTHTGEKRYKCTECPFISARACSLKEHIRVHTGETPYECKLCDYKAAQSSSLTRHMRTHTRENHRKMIEKM